MNKEQLRREEVRGLFALGVIATVIAFRQEFAATSSLARLFVLEIALNWGLYAFLMTIGVSDDVFKPSIIQSCLILAKLVFWGGVVGVGEAVVLGAGNLFLGGLDRGLTVCDPSAIICFHGLFGILALPLVVGVFVWFFQAAHIWREGWSWATSDIRNWHLGKRGDSVSPVVVERTKDLRRGRRPGKRSSTRTRRNKHAPKSGEAAKLVR